MKSATDPGLALRKRSFACAGNSEAGEINGGNVAHSRRSGCGSLWLDPATSG